MAFSTRNFVWYPILNHIREALSAYYTSWENEGGVILEETYDGNDPYSVSTPLAKQVVYFRVTGWKYKMPNVWKGINTDDEMVDTISSDRVKYTAKIDFSVSDDNSTYIYKVTCTPDSDVASLSN